MNMTTRDLLLVNPSHRSRTYGSLGTTLAGIEPPVWTGLLAGFLRSQGFTVAIIDADAEGWGPEETAEKILEYQPLLIGISAIGSNPSASSTPKMVAVGRILRLLHEKLPASKTFLYGIHPSALPERTLREELVDFVCRGECFHTVRDLVQLLKSQDRPPQDFPIDGLWYWKGEQIVRQGWGKIVDNVDNLSMVAWDLLPMDKYRAHNWHCFGHLDQRTPYATVYTSLGCPFHCSYCNIHALYGEKPFIRFRSPENVMEEIDWLVRQYGVKHIKFLDELFALKESRVDALCDLLIQRDYDLNIWAYARVDTVNESMLRKMKQAGIHWLAYGFESGNKAVRENVIKGQFGQDAITKAVQMTHDAGIHIIGNFMFGLPKDTLETMEETLEMAKALNLEYVNFYTTMAYPGSQLYEEAVLQGLPLPETWLGYSQLSAETFPLPTKYLSSAAVLRFRDRAFEEYFRNSAYLTMIEEQFGKETVGHIQQMLTHKIQRKFV
jgi:anaerobic magnesium-protoporphyrin IX monomethyl ester cyclase